MGQSALGELIKPSYLRPAARSVKKQTDRSRSQVAQSINLVSVKDGGFPSVTYQGDMRVGSSSKSQE